MNAPNPEHKIESACIVAIREACNLLQKGDNAPTITYLRGGEDATWHTDKAVVHWENGLRRLDVVYEAGRQDLIRHNRSTYQMEPYG